MLESRKMWALLVIKAMKASPVEFGEDFESFEEPTSLASQMLTTLFQVRVEKIHCWKGANKRVTCLRAMS